MSSVYLNRLGDSLIVLLLAVAAPMAQAQKIPATPPLVAAATAAAGGVIPAPPTTPQQKSLLLQMQDAFTNITQAVEPTVVNIKSERQDSPGDDGSGGGILPRSGLPFGGPSAPRAPRRAYATGSGVIVRGDGYILTNDHVVDGAVGGAVTVTLYDGREFKGKVFPDYKSDLAIVKIEPGAAPLPVAQFSNGVVQPGQWAIAVGSPFDLQNTVTVGIISAVGRHQRIAGDGGQARYYPDLIQTDAAINPGNSGGPLFNIDGKIVGINVAIESPVEGSAGVGFAIPVSIAQTIAATLIGQGKVRRGYLGLAPVDLTPAVVEQYGQKQGAFVQDVVLDSPAGKAGLQAADIVTSFDGKPITDEVTLRQAIAATTPGQKVAITYVRDGAPATATATIGDPPDQTVSPPPSTPAAPAQQKLGLSVRDLTARDRVSLNLPADTTGVVVVRVTPGGPAESAAAGADVNLTGAVIQKINRTPIHNKQEFAQAAAALSPDAPVTLIVVSVQDAITHQQALTLRQ